jgi:diacylglycerol kinase (ATP)
VTEQVPPKCSGLRRVLNACLYTRDGLVATFRSEAAFRQELALALVLVPLAFYLGPDRNARALMVGSIFIVLIVELLNSAIESAINRFGPEWNAFSKHAKDAASAAVGLSLANVAIVWAICLF